MISDDEHLFILAICISSLENVYSCPLPHGVYIRIQLHSFECGYPVFPALFVKETVLSSLSGLGIL